MSDSQREARLAELWEHLDRLGITEQDVADAVAWARANPGAQDVDSEVSTLLQRYKKVPHK